MKYLEQEISLWTEIILCITGLSNTKPVKTQNCTEIHPPCYYNAALTVIIPQRLSKRRDTTSHVEYQKSYLKCRKWNVTESFSDKWKRPVLTESLEELISETNTGLTLINQYGYVDRHPERNYSVFNCSIKCFTGCI